MFNFIFYINTLYIIFNKIIILINNIKVKLFILSSIIIYYCLIIILNKGENKGNTIKRMKKEVLN